MMMLSNEWAWKKQGVKRYVTYMPGKRESVKLKC